MLRVNIFVNCHANSLRGTILAVLQASNITCTLCDAVFGLVFGTLTALNLHAIAQLVVFPVDREAQVSLMLI